MSELLIAIFILYFIYLYRAMKKSKIESPQKSTPKVNAKQSMEAVATQTISKKASPEKKATQKPKSDAAKSLATPEIAMSERVGLTAGSVWQYLSKHGAISVAKLVKELPEDEKIIQRSIGWLAQEGKVKLDTIDRVETIALK